MFASAVPQWLTDTAAFVGACTIIFGGVTAVVTRKPFRWVWRRLVSEPFGTWFKHRSIEANEPLAKAIEATSLALSEHREYVAYHLGPNGETTPVHQRLKRLEYAHAEAINALGEDVA
ncbi:MAG: hypothetical protein ACOYOQ_00600 [Microthrixaceae bacterium]